MIGTHPGSPLDVDGKVDRIANRDLAHADDGTMGVKST